MAKLNFFSILPNKHFQIFSLLTFLLKFLMYWKFWKSFLFLLNFLYYYTILIFYFFCLYFRILFCICISIMFCTSSWIFPSFESSLSSSSESCRHSLAFPRFRFSFFIVLLPELLFFPHFSVSARYLSLPYVHKFLSVFFFVYDLHLLY